MLRGKRGKPFLVQFIRSNNNNNLFIDDIKLHSKMSTISQMILFRTIKFRRTSKNYFGQFVWIEKKIKKVTIIVAFHFMKRRLKISQLQKD